MAIITLLVIALKWRTSTDDITIWMISDAVLGLALRIDIAQHPDHLHPGQWNDILLLAFFLNTACGAVIGGMIGLPIDLCNFVLKR